MEKALKPLSNSPEFVEAISRVANKKGLSLFIDKTTGAIYYLE